MKYELPEGYEVVKENDIAIIAHNEGKQEYAVWNKDKYSGGVCWGRYFSYYFENEKKEEVFKSAMVAYDKKTRGEFSGGGDDD